MRFLHLVYVLTILLAGGMLSRRLLRDRPLRWALLFLPVCLGMFLGQHFLFPASDHIDWPGAAPKNQWVQAFQWISRNTPQDAYFTINSNYMASHGEDEYGFRAVAERSQLADYSKDAAVAAQVPQLAPRWQHEVHALDGFENFTPADFAKLREQFGVDWTMIELSRAGAATAVALAADPGVAHLDCPYRNAAVAVCRIPRSAGSAAGLTAGFPAAVPRAPPPSFL